MKCKNCGRLEEYHPNYLSSGKPQTKGEEVFLDWNCEQFIPSEDDIKKLTKIKMKEMDDEVYNTLTEKDSDIPLSDKIKGLLGEIKHRADRNTFACNDKKYLLWDLEFISNKIDEIDKLAGEFK